MSSGSSGGFSQAGTIISRLPTRTGLEFDLPILGPIRFRHSGA